MSDYSEHQFVGRVLQDQASRVFARRFRHYAR
mgnify:CR=1 FL=1